MPLPAAEFTSSHYDKGAKLGVARNYVGYREENALNVVTYDSKGSLLSNLGLSVKDTKGLIKVLQEILAKNEELKPKEPTVPEQIEALPVGAVFNIDSSTHMLFARVKGGTIHVGTPHKVYKDFEDYSGWRTLYVHFNPKEEK